MTRALGGIGTALREHVAANECDDGLFDQVIETQPRLTHIVARLREFYRRRDENESLQKLNLNTVAAQVIDMTRPRWRDIPQSKGVTIEMPTKKPRGGELTALEKAANRALARRRVSIEHVNSSIKRCRILKDVCRLLRTGVRDLVMEICCALHNFRLRLDPWLPIP